MFYLSVYHIIPKDKFLEYLKWALPLKDYDAFLLLRGSVFDKALFCLGEMKGMLVNNEHSRIGDLLMSVWDQRKEILYGGGSVCIVSQTNPLQSVRPMALSAVVVKCDWIIIIIINYYNQSCFHFVVDRLLHMQ